MADGYEILDTSGYTSTVYYLPGDPPRACKAFNKECVTTHFPVEKEAYERFSKHNPPSSILRYYGNHDVIPFGIILELADKKNLHEYRWDIKRWQHPSDPLPETLYRWASQAAEGLKFAHSLGVCNSDIHCVNFFLDQELNLKVGDWAGASIDGAKSHSSYRLRYRLFDTDGKDVPRATGITASTEIFALGTAIYYMVTCEEPWPELREPDDREEIKRRIRTKKFPDTRSFPILGNVIRRCWYVDFTSMTEVCDAIEEERKRANN